LNLATELNADAAEAAVSGIKAGHNSANTNVRDTKIGASTMENTLRKLGWWSALLGLALVIVALPTRSSAQDQYQDQNQQDDPPSRVARLGYMEGSVSFEPAGENDWVGAVPNRPMTTGDKIWADKDSRAELQLGSATIRLAANTGCSFLNLDDRTAQIQLTSGSLNVRVRQLDQNDVFEIDTPNLAFSIYQPGSYRVEASEDGTYTVVTIREGDGEATGNGQTYRVHAGQRATFSGTDSLNADVEQVGDPDQFDNWAYNRDHRYEESRSAQYVSHDVVGYEDLDDNGDWREEGGYGHVWFPHVAVGWAPYHEGHWAWISPWGYTWVDDSPWGYAPFHYGRWVSVGGRWGWIAGPVAVRAVYAPALVVFIGGGPGGFGGNVGWFPLGPREVYVPSYHVSQAYVNRVNISNTTVNVTQVTNVYNTTIINKTTTNITNITYANRNVQGAVTAVPQRAFAGAQPVAKAAVVVSARDIAAAPVSARVAVAPTHESVLGVKAATANRVTAPPAAVANRQVVAKATPPPPPVAFAKQQQAMAAHPGEPLAKHEIQSLRPATAAAAQPMVKQAPPGKPATPTMGRPGTQPGNQPGNPANAARPGQPAGAAPANQPNAAKPAQPAFTPPNNQPANRPGNQPANQPAPNERPGAAAPAQPNRPFTPPNQPAQPNQPAPNNRPEANRPPAAQPNPPNNRPEMNRPPAAQPNQPAPNNRPETNRPPTPPNQPQENNRPNQPNNPPQQNRPETNRPPAPNNPPPNRPEPARPAPSQNEPNRNQPAPRPPAAPNDRPPQHTPPPPAAKPAPQKPQPKPQTPEEKKKQEQQKPPGE